MGVIPNTDEGFKNDVVSTVRHYLRIALKGFQDCSVDIGRLGENAMVSTQCGLFHASTSLIEEIHSLDSTLPAILEEETARI